jgi:hypothetical protein
MYLMAITKPYVTWIWKNAKGVDYDGIKYICIHFLRQILSFFPVKKAMLNLFRILPKN